MKILHILKQELHILKVEGAMSVSLLTKLAVKVVMVKIVKIKSQLCVSTYKYNNITYYIYL